MVLVAMRSVTVMVLILAKVLVGDEADIGIITVIEVLIEVLALDVLFGAEIVLIVVVVIVIVLKFVL